MSMSSNQSLRRIDRTHPSRGRGHRRCIDGFVVIDDFPDSLPVTEEEIRIIEAYFGPLIREMLGTGPGGDSSGAPGKLDHHGGTGKILSSTNDSRVEGRKRLAPATPGRLD